MDKKWLIIVVCLMIMWGGIMSLLYFKADEVTKNPCSICAKRMGVNVQCTLINTTSSIPIQIQYLPNGTIIKPGSYLNSPDLPININISND